MSPSPLPRLSADAESDSVEPTEPDAKKQKADKTDRSSRFVCDQCQRSFGRVEHLRRHLGGHTEERPFKCSTCNKSFLRNDTLQRHEQIHSEENSKTKPKGSRACSECATAKVKCTNTLPCTRCSNKSLVCRYPKAGPPASIRESPGPPFDSSPNGSIQAPIRDIVSEPSPFNTTMGIAQLAGTLRSPVEESPAETVQSAVSFSSTQPVLDVQARTIAEVPLLSTTISLPNPVEAQVQLASPDVWQQHSLSATNWISNARAPELLIGPGLTPVSRKDSPPPFKPLAGEVGGSTSSRTGDESSTSASRRWLETVTGDPRSFRIRSSPSSTSRPLAGTSEFYVDGDGARLAKMSYRRRLNQTQPSTHFDLDSGIPLTAASRGEGFPTTPIPWRDIPGLGISSNQLLDEKCYNELRRHFQILCLEGCVSHPSFGSNHFPSRNDFNALIMLYLESFQPIVPIFHVPTLDLSQSHWIIPLAMASIGCQFLEMEDYGPFSSSIYEFLHRSILYKDENEDKYTSAQELEMAQARLMLSLSLTYSRLGNESTYKKARSIHKDLTHFCYREWYKDTTIMNLTLPDQSDRESITRIWYEWRGVELRRRMGYAIWLLDCMLVYHINHRPRLEIRDATVPLPCPEILWEAGTAMQWRQVMEYSEPSPTLKCALESIYIEKKMQSTMGEFSRIILIHGLYQRLWEVQRYLMQPLTYWTPSAKRSKPEDVIPKEMWLPDIPWFSKWRNSTCDSLDILHWSANSVIGAASGLEHPTVSHLHLARVILLTPLEDIQRFAFSMSRMKSLTDDQISTHRKMIRRWALNDQHKARLAMIHAGCLFWHIRRYSASAFYEPHAVLLAGLSLWAFGTFMDPDNANSKVPEPSFAEDETSLPTSINLDRPADDELVQTFIRRGGKMLAMMSGVGDVCGIEGPDRILKETIKLLRTLTNWGCSGNAIRVLSSLSQVSRETILTG